MSEPFAKALAAQGYQFRENQEVPLEAEAVTARYYRAEGAGIYFVSPPAHEASGAVSSKP